MFNSSQIFLNMDFKNKQELFNFIASKAVEYSISPSKKIVLEGLKKREAVGSTLLTYNMAFPHTRHSDIKSLITFLITLKEPIKFFRNKTAKIIFCVLSPEDAQNEYLQNMSKCAYITLNKNLLKMLDTLPSEKNTELAEEINNFLDTKYSSSY